MRIFESRNFSRQKKKLKRNYEEMKNFESLILHMRIMKDFTELENHPYSKRFGFERLKHNLNKYYSFNLCRNGGQVRLLFTVDKNDNIIFLAFISMKHYKDFDEKEVMKYEKE